PSLTVGLRFAKEPSLTVGLRFAKEPALTVGLLPGSPTA
ncbi:MAG: hypothetical protein QOD33_443, partial [Pyrinomonadaceae bacterium]|nr:hypothetical protein [Pyrinomonadaceae bacterium]